MTSPAFPKHDAAHQPARPHRLQVQLILAGALVAAVIAILLAHAVHVSSRQSDDRAQQRRSKTLAAIQQGRLDEAIVYDGKLIEMIAADPTCVERTTSLVFSDVDFSEPGFEQLSRLERLADVGAYSCDSADRLLFHLQDMPSIRKLWFEASPLSEEGLRLLTTLPGLTHVRFEQTMSSQQVQLLRSTLKDVRLVFLREPNGGR